MTSFRGWLNADTCLNQSDERCHAIVSVELARFMFGNIFWDRLASTQAKRAVSLLLQRQLPMLLRERSEEAARLLQRLSPAKKPKRTKTKKRFTLARALAKNPKTNAKVLEELSRANDSQVNAALLVNPNTPQAILLKLAPRRPRLFWKNPLTPLLLLSDPSSLLKLPAKVLLPLLRQRGVSPSLMAALQDHPEALLLFASCPETPTALLRLVQEKNQCRSEELQVELFFHPNSDDALRAAICERRECRALLARDHRVPLLFIEELLRDHRDDVVIEAAKNPRLPSVYFEELSRGPIQVRASLAQNPGTPPELLSRLASDPSCWVRRCAAEHPATPRELVSLLRRAGAHQELLGVDSTIDPSLSVQELSRLSELGAFARWLVWHHPNTTAGLRERCEKDRWFQQRRALEDDTEITL